MKRFYKEAEAISLDGGGFTVVLDSRPMRTPKKAPLALPTAPLAEAIAAEWAAQGEDIKPRAMPLTKLANTTIDWVGPERARVQEMVAGYGGSDLICYHADAPAELVARQAQYWRPLLRWAEQRYAISLKVTRGIIHQEQDAAARAAFAAAVAVHDDIALMTLHDVTTITGSLVIGLALAEDEIAFAQAWTAAHVDEDHQAERWGVDAEARARQEARKADLESALRFLSLSRS